MNLRIKIFSDNDIVALEQRINYWLEENPTIDVLKLAQTEAREIEGDPWSARITLLYRDTGRATGYPFQEMQNAEPLTDPVFFDDEHKRERMAVLA